MLSSFILCPHGAHFKDMKLFYGQSQGILRVRVSGPAGIVGGGRE